MSGDAIVKQGDPSDVMYIIEDGVCEVSVEEKNASTGKLVHRCDTRMHAVWHGV